MPDAPLSDVERIKAESRHLRGTLAKSLADPLTGALRDDDAQLSKFHGFYQQDDRDLRSERKRQRLEPAYSFMIRARIPAGVCTPAQWLAMHDIAKRHANGSIRLTTRQAIQFHGVIKRDLKTTIAAINAAMLDTLAACGDVNRNVMAPALPVLSRVHRAVQADAELLSTRLTPATRAYHELWLDGEKVTGPEEEPIYGDTYLPRKFKLAFVVPPLNDVDVFTQDLGFIAIVEGGEVVGYNVSVGGGMGMSHGEPSTYPRLGEILGFCSRERVTDVATAVVTAQRDYGDRGNRKHARLKYTIDDRGLDWFREEVGKRMGSTLQPARPFRFVANGDACGWSRGDDGQWHYTLFVENGRIDDAAQRSLLTGLREIARVHDGEFRLTPNQNLIISDVDAASKREIDDLLAMHGIANDGRASPLRQHALACVGLPTCGLAMAESERYLPSLVSLLERELQAAGIGNEAITLRMTGCPNGCARPYVAEVGLVGKGPGRYNLYLGAAFNGERLNSLYLDNADEPQIVAELGRLFRRFAAERRADERFGDYLVRSGVVARILEGRDFHGPHDHG